MRITLNNVNAEIKDLGYELVRGDGYFYFWALEPETPELYEQSVYVNHLTSFSVARWRALLVDKIENA